MNRTTKWDHRFLGLANHIAQWSKDPSTKVGAVITRDNRIVSLGYNGFPQGVSDNHRLDDRDTKYSMVIHAEENAILFSGADLTGCTLYVTPLSPCSRCAAKIIQAGISRVVSLVPEDNERWEENAMLSLEMFEEVGISLSTYKEIE